jgi:Flp pilus assembly protein CpaB
MPVVILLLFMAVVIGGVGTVGTLWALGEIDLPFFKKDESEKIPPGAVGIPVSARKILAYSKVTRDDLLDPQTKRIKVMYLMPEQIPAEALQRLPDILGQVLNHEKPPGYAFTDADFLPKGTRPGLAAGVPAGKRAMTIEASKLGGSQAVRPGDHIDVIASMPVDVSKVPKGLLAGGGSSSPLLSPAIAAKMQKQATVRVIVQDGVAVSPVTTRMVPILSASLTRGATTRTKPVQEIVIAIEPSEVSPLSEALAIAADLTCVVRSGRPDDPGEASVTPDPPNPLTNLSWVETIRGGKREWVVASPPPIPSPQAPQAN